MAFHLLAAEQARGGSTGGTSSQSHRLCGRRSVLAALRQCLYRGQMGGGRPAALHAGACAALSSPPSCFCPSSIHYRAEMMKLLKERWIELLVIGGSGLFLTQGLIFLGLLYTDVINCGLIISLMPIITMVLAFFVLGEPMGGWQAVGAAVSFIGMIVIIVHGQLSQLLGLNFNIGELWVLLGAFGFGLYTVLLRRAKFTMDRLPLLVMLLLAGSAVGIAFRNRRNPDGRPLHAWTCAVHWRSAIARYSAAHHVSALQLEHRDTGRGEGRTAHVSADAVRAVLRLFAARRKIAALSLRGRRAHPARHRGHRGAGAKRKPATS